MAKYIKVSLLLKSHIPFLAEIIILNLSSQQVLRNINKDLVNLTQSKMSQFIVSDHNLGISTSDMLNARSWIIAS